MHNNADIINRYSSQNPEEERRPDFTSRRITSNYCLRIFRSVNTHYWMHVYHAEENVLQK